MCLFDRCILLLSFVTLTLWVIIFVGVFVVPKIGYGMEGYFIILLALTSSMSASLLIESITRSRG